MRAHVGQVGIDRTRPDLLGLLPGTNADVLIDVALWGGGTEELGVRDEVVR